MVHGWVWGNPARCLPEATISPYPCLFTPDRYDAETLVELPQFPPLLIIPVADRLPRSALNGGEGCKDARRRDTLGCTTIGRNTGFRPNNSRASPEGSAGPKGSKRNSAGWGFSPPTAGARGTMALSNARFRAWIIEQRSSRYWQRRTIQHHTSLCEKVALNGALPPRRRNHFVG
jgi:hypothetical protein